jgi:uncharacterized protein (TIGR03790 family)
MNWQAGSLPYNVSRALILALCPTFAILATVRAADLGETVVVVYNRRMPESKSLAEYYSRQRQVPTDQLFGFDLPETETISRRAFREQLQQPLLKLLEEKKIFGFVTDVEPATRDKPGRVIRTLATSKIRYAVLCYGVPVRIAPDSSLIEEGSSRLKPELRRNEAAVDSELAVLPLDDKKLPIYGPLRNVFYGVANAEILDPTAGLLMVTRLDGPTVEIARGLIDKAIQAETDGLWGRAYFDVRGLTEGNYKLGDDWIRDAEKAARLFGFDTELDTRPETFPSSFPMSHVALYAGWYDVHVSGPFARGAVEFVPGAFAYHLHSFSAATIRTADQQWVGPLLARGATATMGCVDEPYLEGTPDVAVFITRFLSGFSFGEAAYASQNALSWQTTIVGDPLYRPFASSPTELHQRLLERHSKLLEWSHLFRVNRKLASKLPAAQVIDELEEEPLTKQSAVLEEKLGDLYSAEGKTPKAIDAYTAALKLETTQQQRLRMMLNLARALNVALREREAYDLYKRFLKSFPDYPDPASIYHKLLPLAHRLGKKQDAEYYQLQIERQAEVAPAK